MKKSMQTNEIIKLWKELNIDRCEMQFSCGGDSMNETEFVLYDTNNEIVENAELTDYFEGEVYREVEFYEVSDGQYMGEFGQVVITLEEDEEDENGGVFIYDKQATGEWEDTFSTDITIELNAEERELLLTKVESINGGGWDNELNVNYKDDCVLTDEEETLLENLLSKIKDESDNAEIEGEGEETDGDDRSFESEIEIENGSLIVSVSGRFYYTRESFD
jgi:hypothetical protein